MMKKFIAVLLVFVTLLTLSGTAAAFGTKAQNKGYLVLGADLTADQQKTVLKFLQVKNTSDYVVSYTTNQQEHEAFDGYLSPSVIGSRALSSILMVPSKKGNGISVSSYNITYCTVEMYQNALISAGVQDVAVYIAAPCGVSGTCALLSAMNAYSTLSGETISTQKADIAIDELVTTGQVGDVIGSNDTAAELVAMLKQQMIEHNLDRDDLDKAIDAACGKMDVSLDDSTKEQLLNLMMKIKDIDIDVNALAKQASGLYKKVSATMQEMGITKEQAVGLFNKFIQWLSKLLG